jgi:hypothetical protein
MFMAIVPMVMGNNASLVYAPRTLSNSRSRCWDRVLRWADDTYVNSERFRVIYEKHGTRLTPQLRQHIAMWARYDPMASRAAQMAWLRRRGCRVQSGYFTKQELKHEEAP